MFSGYVNPQGPPVFEPSAIDPTAATSVFESTQFLYTGPNPIQTGVAPGTIRGRHASVIRGRVLERDGAPLPGVTVTVHERPEFGQTITREDGWFDLAVNGGDSLTIDFQKTDRLPVQRTLYVAWRGFANASDVVMIGLDPAMTPVAANAPDMQVHQGTLQIDDDGERQATLLFPAGTGATLVLPDGTTQPLTSLDVRATEYTVGERGPEAMPAELPPASEYTYCFTLSAEEESSTGATTTVFSQPIPFYVENFLGLPVGFEVPLGAYDPGLASWVAEDNGVVVKILVVTGGLAELDADGTGIPADAAKLAALGVSNAERQQLGTLYPPGATLWRLRLPHLSDGGRAWDANMGKHARRRHQRRRRFLQPYMS